MGAIHIKYDKTSFLSRLQLKIAVCEGWGTVAPFGGHQIEVAAYASLFEEFGHDVTIFAEVRPEDFRAEARKRFSFNGDVRPLGALSQGFDIYWIGFTWLVVGDITRGSNCVSFWIDPYLVKGNIYDRNRWPDPRKAISPNTRIWTLSSTMLSGIRKAHSFNGKASVHYAPLDYSLFREKAKPWADRKYNVAWVGRISSEKRPSLVSALTEGNSVVITPDDPSNCGVSFKAKVVIDPCREEQASIMGDSRVLILPSLNECASLVLYEAMNAGCYVIATDTGSAEEQIGKENTIRWDHPAIEDEFHRKIGEALSSPYDEKTSIERGLMFDLAHRKNRIKEDLEGGK